MQITGLEAVTVIDDKIMTRILVIGDLRDHPCTRGFDGRTRWHTEVRTVVRSDAMRNRVQARQIEC